MALNATETVIHQEDRSVNYVDNRFFKDIKQWPYKRVCKALQANTLSQKKDEEFIAIKLTEYFDESDVLQTFYRLQLLGYIPIIIELEKNISLKHRTSMIHQLIVKGALVHIDALSLLGENGREAKKYASKLCEKGYVHLVTANESEKKGNTSVAVQVDHYLKKKTSEKYVKFLKENKRNVYLGRSFHILKSEDEKRAYGLRQKSSLVKRILRR